MTSDQERLEEIARLRRELDTKRAELFAAIHSAFHEREEPAARGWLTRVTKASGYTREHIANIRDGKARVSPDT